MNDRILETYSAEETFRFAREMGEHAVPGQIICLNGDLGTGKTVFTQGFAAGLGIEEPVSSPTFTILQTYEGGRLPFYHFDVYRIGDIREMEEIGWEDCFYGEGVSVMEWACLVEEIIPEDAVRITLEKNPEKGWDYRKITVKGGKEGEKNENSCN